MPTTCHREVFFATYPSKRRQKGTPSRFAGAGRDGYSCMVSTMNSDCVPIRNFPPYTKTSNITTHYGAKKNLSDRDDFFSKFR